MDRSKKDSPSKIQTNISHSIWHGFQWFKAQHHQHKELYINMAIILRNEEIELWPLEEAELDSAGSMPCNAQNLLLQCLCEWLDEELRPGCARIFKNLNPPLLSSSFKCEQNCMNCYGSCFNLAQELSRSTNQPKEMQIVQEFERKFWEKKEWKISRSEKWSVVIRILLCLGLYTPC